ncbi:YwiC-like family protein [Cohnella soli]|uniref:YwiC-like family protein n=1 Tax=Cohnella soli TaxID=425005 RepID=A0ABW0I1W4_9BACL
MNNRSVVIPHEQGDWAMVSVPILLGMLAGIPRWAHVPLFLV